LSIRKSDLLITVSHNSKKDIISLFNVPASKIHVVYEAANKDFCPMVLHEIEKRKLKNEYKLSDKFILYVGVIENRKNIYGILNIADLVYSNSKDLKFLLIGRLGYGAKNILREVKKRKNVVYIEYVEDLVLKKLYSMSRAFLFLSFYEGFGLPPLEAMQSGVPVIISNTSALAEVVNSGGIMHDPTDYQSIYGDLLKLIEDDKYYLFWQKRGLDRAKNFSTYKTTKHLIDIFNSINN
ncbi:MAG: glycosyltransferase family 4 protein, partial [Ignavibacteriaceae bacterium]|nr:glycosyltransferase family 4 protein [Ignavibacteriaceae bacterium]